MTEYICVCCGCCCGETGTNDDGSPWGCEVLLFKGSSYCENCFYKLKMKEKVK